MKKKKIIAIILAFWGIFSFSCSKEDLNGLTDEQIMEILENAEQVMDRVSLYFDTSECLNDMAQYLDQIKAIEFVEDAWLEDSSIGVKIVDGGIVTWNFFNNDTTISEADTSSSDDIGILGSKGNVSVGMCANKNACISIAKVAYSHQAISEIEDLLETHGYSVNTVTGSYFNPEFIYKDMPKYGVNIVLAHGGYNSKTGVHRIITGDEYSKTKFKKNVEEWINDGLEIAIVEENRNGHRQSVGYLAVTETFINKKMGKFPDNSLLFAAVCSTLEGNYNMSNILINNKKLGCYFGYDGIVSVERSDNHDLKNIMKYMLNDGNTAREALSRIGSGSNPRLLLRIPANRDVRLYEDKNVFSVSSTKKVKFAKANLNSNGQFCTNSWDYGGRLPWSSYYNNGWRTLSQNEWIYLFNSRLYSSKIGLGMVDNVVGLILLPDQWENPVGCSFSVTFFGWYTNVYNKSKWAKMEANGAVFLPAAFITDEGFRYGYYWTSTPKNTGDAFAVFFYTEGEGSGYGGVLPLGYPGDTNICAPKSYGLSVRLVKDIP